MSTRFSVILTTFSKHRTGSKIIQALLRAKLVACIQVLPMKSFYIWKGKVSRDSEKLMLIKARSSDFAKIRNSILENHDYEIPEIISLEISQGFDRYLDWISEVTQKNRGK